MPLPTKRTAISVLRKKGMLLVFPIKNNTRIPSLWDAFYPGQKMSWEWTDDADGRVAHLWHLRRELSTSREIIYGKWFRNRATLFSPELFMALVGTVSTRHTSELGLSEEAEVILSVLEEDSPLSSREVRRRTGIEGRENASLFERAMKELWFRLLVVGYGEIDEGGFPSLAIGSSRLLFEDLWDVSKELTETDREETVMRYVGACREFGAFYTRFKQALQVSRVEE